MMIPKTKFVRDEKHRRFISTLPCLITGANDVQACHVRKGNPCGTGLKPSDIYCLPLSVDQHRIQHDMGEVEYWMPYLGYKRASRLARDLYAVTGDREKALELIAEWKNEIFYL